MTASRLRHAAAAMREQNIPGRGYMDDTFLAVADSLEITADLLDTHMLNGAPTPVGHAVVGPALAIANAYMQADAKADAL